MYRDEHIRDLYEKYKKKHEYNNLANCRSMMFDDKLTFEQFRVNFLRSQRGAPLRNCTTLGAL